MLEHDTPSANNQLDCDNNTAPHYYPATILIDMIDGDTLHSKGRSETNAALKIIEPSKLHWFKFQVEPLATTMR